MGAYVDPFEAFKKKADVDRPARKEAAAAPEQKISPELDARDLEGRPKGFATHRQNFNKEKPVETPAEQLPRPKGFEAGRILNASEELAKRRPVEVPRPKGFTLGKLGSGLPETKHPS